MNLLMISGDRALAEGKHGAFYNTLEEFHKHWDRIDIICPKTSRGSTSRGFEVEPLFGNVHIHSSPWPLIFQPWWIYRAGLRILKTNGYLPVRQAGSLRANNYLMTVHEYPPFYNGLGAYLLHLAIRVPYVLEIMHVPGLPKSGSVKELIYKYLTKLFIAFDANPTRAVRIINQKQTKDFLVQAGVPASKLKYIPAFYIDLSIFKPEAIDKKYDLIYVARLERNKGILNLLQAVSILREKKPDIRLCIIGDGPLRSEIKDFIIKNSLEKTVELTGWLVELQDIANYLNQSHIFVNPALNEGGPRVALEAMACGVPIVTTKVGIMIDIIQDRQNGLFTAWNPKNIADTIAELLADTELQQKLSRAGLESVKQFERKRAISEYAHVLQNLTKKRLLVITQKVDEQDQLLGFFIEWLRRLGAKTFLSVLCLEKGLYKLPGISVKSLGKEKRNSKLAQGWNFFRYIIKKSDQYDTVFVHMNPIWAVLGGWYWRLMDKKIIFWYTSGGVTTKLKLAEKFADTIFTASKESFRLFSKKVVVTGHGIDTELFKPDFLRSNLKEGISRFDLGEIKILSVGRISPVKNYEIFIDAAKILKDKGLKFLVTVIGEAPLEKDKNYDKNLKSKIKNLKLEDNFIFLGKVNHKNLPTYYQSHDVFVHLSKTGSLDKTILEAMACGMNVLSSNDAARSFLPQDSVFNEDNALELADKIEKISHKNVDGQLRQYVIDNHNLDKLIDKISGLIINK